MLRFKVNVKTYCATWRILLYRNIFVALYLYILIWIKRVFFKILHKPILNRLDNSLFFKNVVIFDLILFNVRSLTIFRMHLHVAFSYCMWSNILSIWSMALFCFVMVTHEVNINSSVSPFQFLTHKTSNQLRDRNITFSCIECCHYSHVWHYSPAIESEKTK